MISVLIPVFNQDINTLVARLSAGFSRLGGAGEIIVMDDASDAAFQQVNNDIASFPFVRYSIQSQNQGRIRIRQKLAEAATGHWLLFLDGDSELITDDFLDKYTKAVATHTGVIVGGRTYDTAPPEDCTLRLHWTYGLARENRRAGKKHQPAFMTNNFIIEAQCFKQLSFETGGEGYGHEDTWIGMQLEQAAIPVAYIDNPVLHAGLERNNVFITKSENALVNLHRLSNLVPPADLARHVKLFRIYRSLKSWKGEWIPLLLYNLFKSPIRRNLFSCKPSLTYFDLYRLQYFIRLHK
jgi:glycosyltransferase involved in cell wall biosynthesis